MDIINEPFVKRIKNMESVTFYHGSRGGIDGKIKPISRERCDFGRGFYMGTNPEQAKGLVVEDTSPIFYTVEVDFSKIPPENILYLENTDWLYAVLAFRKKSSEFSSLQLAKEIMDKVNSYDIVIGAIADDRMNDAVKAYTDYSLTDKGFAACLSSIDYGYQIVAKTEFACESIKILAEHELYGQEADNIREYNQRQRFKSRDVIKDMRKKYQRDGKFLNELVEEMKQIETHTPRQERQTEWTK